MANAGTVNVNLVAQTAAFHAGMEKAEGAIKSLEGKIQSAAHIAEAFLGYEAIKKVAEWVSQTMEAVEHQTRLADSLGVSTEAMTALAYSTTIAGGSTEVLGAAMLKMEEHLSGIGGATGKTVDALRAMGLSMKDLQGKTGDEQLMLIADGMKNVSSSGDRAKIAVDIFGKAGASLLPILNQGSEKLREQAKEAEALGITYNRVDAAKIMAANEALKKGGEVLQGGLLAATKELAPLIEGVVNYFVDAAKQAGGFGTIATTAMDYLVKAIGVAADAINVLIAGWDATKVAMWMVVRGLADFGVVASTVIFRVSDYLENFATALGKTGAFISRMWTLVWDAVQFGAAVAVSVMGESFAGLMRDMATLASFVDSSLAASMKGAADRISQSSKAIRDDHRTALQNSIADTKYAADEMGNAWKGIFKTSGEQESSVINFFKGLSAKANAGGEDAAMHFLKMFQKVIGQDASHAFEEWYAAQKAAAQKHAEDEAAEKQRQVDEDKAIAAEKLAVDTEFANKIREGLDGRVLMENEDYDKRIKNLKSYHDQALLSDAEFKLAEEQANAEHQQRLAEVTVHAEAQVTKWEVMNSKEKIAFTVSMLNNLASLMQSHNKKAFELGKAAAYASTVIQTAQGAMAAYAQMCSMGPYGWILGAAAAACVIAAGVTQLANISSTSFDGGGGISGGSFSSGSSAIAGAGSGPVGPSITTPGTNTQQQAPVVQFVLSGINDDDIYTGKAFRKMLQGLNDAQKNGSPVEQVGVL